MFQIPHMKFSESIKSFLKASKSVSRFYISQVATIPFLMNTLYMLDPDKTPGIQPNRKLRVYLLPSDIQSLILLIIVTHPWLRMPDNVRV